MYFDALYKIKNSIGPEVMTLTPNKIKLAICFLTALKVNKQVGRYLSHPMKFRSPHALFALVWSTGVLEVRNVRD